ARGGLAQASGKVGQMGAVADYLDVERGYERAVEACLGDVLQHVVVERPEHAAAGFQVVREQGAGRCGFLIVGEAPATMEPTRAAQGAAAGLVALQSVDRVNGPNASAIQHVIGDAWVADAYDRALEASRTTPLPVATREGEVFHGPRRVVGGSREEARGILQTKRDIKELRERI